MTNTTKNILLGVLALVIVGLIIYVATAKNLRTTPVVEKPADTTQQDPKPPVPTSSQKPDAPTVTTGGSVTNSSSTATVNGQVKPNGSATTYWFEYGETTALGNRTSAQSIGSGYASISSPGYIVGLKSDTLYYFRLSAKNSFGTVNGATYSFRTNTNQPPVVIHPDIKTVSASDVTRTSATLRGQIDPNGLPATYWFEYGKDASLGYVTIFQGTNNGTAAINVSAPASGLEPQTKYYYRLNAQNAYGTVTGSTMSFTTPGPANAGQPSVTTNSATSVGKTTATLVGRVNPNGDQTKYWFEYSEDSALSLLVNAGTPMGTIEASSGAVTVRADIRDLKPDTKYFYRLVARNSYNTVPGITLSFTTRK
jgi:hypothetical protein